MRAERLEVRVTPQQKSLLVKAAALRGLSLSGFVTRVCQRAAERLVEREQILKLTRKDQAALVHALLDPTPPNSALTAAATAYKERYG